MRPPILHLGTLLLVATLSPSLAADRCGQDSPPCPWTSSAWTLYLDSNPEAPDFWWQAAPLPVHEMKVCEHGIQFLFPATQEGRACRAALVFPRPSRDMLADRLELSPCGEDLQDELDHFEARYASLLAGLERISGGELVEGVHLQFEGGEEPPTPAIVPNTRLVLLWRDEELKLRGYLDVYFRKDPSPPDLAAADDEDRPVRKHGGNPDGVALAVRTGQPLTLSSPKVTPNPGGAGDYVISFAIPASGNVRLEIFNVGGRRVTTLIAGWQDAGKREARWNGRTFRGNAVSSGVYFARVATPEGARTTKFVHVGRH